MTTAPKPIVLIILDGWGYSEKTDCNAIDSARTPFWDKLWRAAPHTLVRCSGTDVGLPGGQMGNSEVGHMNIGSGRVVYQEFTRVARAIKTGSFFQNATLTGAVDAAIKNNGAVHILGLLSPGGVHSHEHQIHAMARLAIGRGARVMLHAFTDGRDTPPKSAGQSVHMMEDLFTDAGGGQFASIIGRYYAMDRDHRWPRIQLAYDLITQGTAEFEAKSATEAIDQAYARGETDEFITATRIVGNNGKPVRMQDDDVIIFMNFRSDRARQITRPFIEDEFSGFERTYRPKLAGFVSLTEYNKNFDIPVAFPAERLSNVLGAYLSQTGLHQLRIAETEKYAHVTFFFNGGVETPFEGEDRMLIPSPMVATYDLKPEMSAFEITEKLEHAIHEGNYDLIVCNFANPDMVGHTGNLQATIRAIEIIDSCLARIDEALTGAGGEMVITADHGNAELLCDRETGQAHTAHTTNLVPLIYRGRRAHLAAVGTLSDIAPSLLHLMGLQPPSEMTGRSLVEFD